MLTQPSFSIRWPVRSHNSGGFKATEETAFPSVFSFCYQRFDLMKHRQSWCHRWTWGPAGEHRPLPPQAWRPPSQCPQDPKTEGKERTHRVVPKPWGKGENRLKVKEEAKGRWLSLMPGFTRYSWVSAGERPFPLWRSRGPLTAVTAAGRANELQLSFCQAGRASGRLSSLRFCFLYFL